MRRYLIANIYVSILLKYHHLCYCYKESGSDPQENSNDSFHLKYKRELVKNAVESTEETDKLDTDITITFDNTMITESYIDLTTLDEYDKEDTEEAKTNVEFITTTKTVDEAVIFTESPSNEICQRYIHGDTLDIQKMAGVWQTAYYIMPERLSCFQIHIKILSIQERRTYEKSYGNYNNSVAWDLCVLEVIPIEKTNDLTRHFLQITSLHGVMANIIINEEHYENTTALNLHTEASDQWAVAKNLLIMRDCEEGYVVIFSRVPCEPKREDIIDVLEIFGDGMKNGSVACDHGIDKN